MKASASGGIVHMCVLSHFTHVWLSEIPWTVARQAPLSMGFSRQEYWSGLPFPSPVMKCEVSELAQSCLTLCDPMDCSLTGSSVHGIFQARVLEWGAIAFSGNSRWAISNPERWCCWSAALTMPTNLENSAVATGLEKDQFSFQSQRKAMPKNVQTTAQLHSSHMIAK